MTKKPGSTEIKQVIFGYRELALRVFALLCLFIFGVIIYKYFFNPFFLLGIERRVLFVLVPLGLLTISLYFPYRWVESKLESLLPQWAFAALKAAFIWMGGVGARMLFPVLFITFVLFIWVEAIWEGSVTSYFSMNYLVPITVIFGVVALWLHRDKITSGEEPKDKLAEFQREEEFTRKFPGINRIPIVRWFTRRIYQEGWRYPLLLCLILLACFGIRYYFASIGNINLDEGNGLYDANLILQGKIPFKDYITREPGYMYTLALFIKIFGYSIMTGRLLAIISGEVICFFIFLIGKELYSKNVGLVAALIYCLSPFIIYNDIIGYVQTVSLMWVPITVYFLILAIKGNKLKHYLLSGLFIGIAMLFYRGHLVYLILCPLALIYIHPWEFKNLFRNTATVLLGFCVPVVPVIAYFVLQTDLQWMLMQYHIPIYIITVSHTAVPGGEEVSYFTAKSRVIYSLFRVALYLFIPLLLFFSLLLKDLIRNRKVFLLPVAGLWAFVLYLVVYGKSTEWYAFGHPPLPSGYDLVFFYLLGALYIVGFLVLANIRVSSDLKQNFNFARIFLLVWFFCASIFFIISPVRPDIGVIPGTIMAAIVILVVFQSQNGRFTGILPVMFLVILTLSAVFAGFAYANTPNRDMGIKMSTLNEVARYVQVCTSPDEEIFTCIPAFAVQANRKIVLDISHPLNYAGGIDDPWEGYDPYGTTPSVSEILKYMQSKKIKYIVLEDRTRSIIAGHPELDDFIKANYRVVNSYRDLLNTQILEWGG